jgi:hypothetical protein
MNIEMIFDHSPRMEAMIDGISSDFHFSPVIFGLSAELLGKSVNHLLIAYEGESFRCLYVAIRNCRRGRVIVFMPFAPNLLKNCLLLPALFCNRGAHERRAKGRSRTFQLLYRDFFIIKFSHYSHHSTAVRCRTSMLCVYLNWRKLAGK